jgi:membrane-associated phospholipid phosphatase
MRRLLSLALLLVVPATGRTQTQPVERPPLFTAKDAIWSAAALGGALALSAADVDIAAGFNNQTHRSASRDRLARNFAKVQEGTLTVGNLALWGIGRLTRVDALADITFHAAEAVVVGSVASQVIRGPLGRSRPHVTDYKDQYDFKPFRGFREFQYRAFPSIHTASAFAVATVYVLETDRRAPQATWIVAPIAYALALGPGVSRMYTGQHWASDVLAGAFMGTLAGVKIVRYNHDVRPDNPVNRFFLGREATSGFTFRYSIDF